LKSLVLTTFLLLAIFQGETARLEIVVRDSGTRDGVAGVPVTVTFKFPLEPAGVSSTLVTDPRGVAAFSGLSAGSYVIKLGDGFNSRAIPDYVLLDAGERRHIEIPVAQVARVTGTILGEDGVPYAAAIVSLLSIQYVDGRHAARRTARTTTKGGEFEFTGIPSGDFYLRIEKEDPPRSVSYYPGVGDLDTAAKLSIRGRDVLLGDIKIANRPRFKVSGSLIGFSSASRPTLYIGHDDSRISEDFLSADVRFPGPNTANEMLFELSGLEPGSYVMYPIFRALADPLLQSVTSKANFTVGGSDVQDLKIAWKPSLDIKGRIVSGELNAQFLEHLRVVSQLRDLVPSVLSLALLRPPLAVSETGDFTLTSLMDGCRYGISVQGLPQDAYVSDIRLGGQSLLNEGSFIAGAAVGSLDIHIGRPGGIVAGEVLDAANRPVAGAFVVLIPDFAFRKNSFLYRRTTADSRGQFSVSGLGPGDYHVFAWPTPLPAGAEEDPAFIGPFEGRAARVRATPGIRTEAQIRIIQ
jgi:hypothetical protein